MICNVHVRKGHTLIGFATDRKDFYHQCYVTPQRANSNTMPLSYPASDFAGFAAYKWFKETSQVLTSRDEGRDKLGFKPRGILAAAERLYPTFRSLLQGDHLGVVFALQGHEQLLRSGGLLVDSCQIRGHHPFPIGYEYEGLVIDDYFAISTQSINISEADSAAAKKLRKATAVYNREGVLGSPEKDVLGAP
eukprot:s3267_g11.t1